MYITSIVRVLKKLLKTIKLDSPVKGPGKLILFLIYTGIDHHLIMQRQTHPMTEKERNSPISQGYTSIGLT